MTDSIGMAEILVDDEVRHAVMRSLESGKYVKGPEGAAFEQEFARHHDARHGVAVSNGTTALHLAYSALGVAPGDEIIAPSHTYLATVTPAVHLGAVPVFVEVDGQSMTLDPAAVEAAITPRTKAIAAVHLYGHPAEMVRLREIADEHGIALVADAAQAHDASLHGSMIGNVGADVTTFSFYPSKNMTVCGDGGMVLTNDSDLAERLSMLRDHGRVPSKKYENDLLGFNFRLSDMLAAIGRVQLKHLRAWTDRRREVAAQYRKELGDLPWLSLPQETRGARHAYHQFVVRTSRRDELARHLKAHGISSGLHYPVPTHAQPCIVERFGMTSMPATEALVGEILSLPVHQGLADADVARVIDCIRAFPGS